MKKFSLFLLILILGCQKEDNNINSTRNDFVGYYCGEITTSGQWGSFNTEVFKSETDSNKIIFDFFSGSGLDSVEAIVNGYNLTIPEQTYRKSATTSAGPWGEVYYYDVTIFGNGTLDIDRHFMHIDLRIRETYDNGALREVPWVIEMYNSSNSSYIGTYTGDNTTVTISQYGDSLLLSITFWEDFIPGGWENIVASDNPCSISFSKDSIADIATGDMYSIMGGGHKMGDSLRFTFNAYYHGSSPLYIYDFTVGKTE